MRKYFKAFRVGDLFERKTGGIGIPMKILDISDSLDSSKVPLISSSSDNNGITGFIEKNTKTDKLLSNCLTIAIAGYSGTVFYQSDSFYMTGDVNFISIKNENLKILLDSHKESYSFISKMLTTVSRPFRGFHRKISTGNDFDREIILLPTYNNEIDPELMGYLYHLSMVKKYTKEINTYKDKIKKLKGVI